VLEFSDPLIPDIYVWFTDLMFSSGCSVGSFTAGILNF